MSKLHFGLVGFLLLVLVSSPAFANVEYTMTGSNSVANLTASSSFDLFSPGFVTGDTTFTTWQSCTYDVSILGMKNCTSIEFLSGVSGFPGVTTADEVVVHVDGGFQFDIFFPDGAFTSPGTYQNLKIPVVNFEFGQLTVSGTPSVPEPTSFSLLGCAIAGVVAWRRSRLGL